LLLLLLPVEPEVLLPDLVGEDAGAGCDGGGV
jgi:hypothetical protein